MEKKEGERVRRIQKLAKVRSWLEDGVEVGKTAEFTSKKADRDFIFEELEGLSTALIESTESTERPTKKGFRT